jgi:hypothetical protein
MALLVDKLRPRTLDALSYHPELSDRLRSLVIKPDLRSMNTILTQGTLHRHEAEISPIYWSMDPRALARKHESLRH